MLGNSVLTVEKFERHKELSKEILHIDPHIRFVGVINKHGKLNTGAVRKNVKLRVEQKDCEMLYMEAMLRMRMQQEFDHCLGPVNFCMSHRKNFIITKYPLGEYLIYVSADKNFDFTQTPFKIIALLKKVQDKSTIIAI